MAIVFSQNSLPFRERAGLTPTIRGPLPAFQPALNPALNVAVAVPLPAPYYLRNTQGTPPPDRGPTQLWPFGNASGD